MVKQYAHADGQAEVEMDWDWRIAGGLWTVGVRFSGDPRNPLEDLPDESHPVKHPGNQPAKECSSAVGKYRATRNESWARGILTRRCGKYQVGVMALASFSSSKSMGHQSDGLSCRDGGRGFCKREVDSDDN